MRHSKLIRSLGVGSAALILTSACAVEDSEQGSQGPAEEGPFVLGTLLPQTGPAAQFGPAMTAAVNLAAEDMNSAGGILGHDVEIVAGDAAGKPNIASQSLDRLLADGADAIMGTGSSSVTLALLDKVASAEVSMCSGANTSPELTTADDGGYFFRTSYSQSLQGPVLAQLVIEDGNSRVALIGRGDAFGKGLTEATAKALKEGGAEVVQKTIYDPKQTTFAAEIESIASLEPEAVVVVGYDERGKIFRAMIERGIGPDDIDLYTTGILANDFWKLVDPSNPAVIEGLTQTGPPLQSKSEFAQRILDDEETSATDVQFAAEQYDCAIITGLAAHAAGSTDASVYKDEIANVTREGTECEDYASCIEALDNGEDIVYNGKGGVYQFSDAGEPTRATFQIYGVDETGASFPTEQTIVVDE